MIFSIFDQTTGIVVGHLSCSSSSATEVVKHRTDIIEGEYAVGQYQIVDGQAVEIQTADDVAQQNVQNEMRNFRNLALGRIDRINPVWYDSLTAEQREELRQYRQALLDVPQQPGFPETVEWPVQPAWF